MRRIRHHRNDISSFGTKRVNERTTFINFLLLTIDLKFSSDAYYNLASSNGVCWPANNAFTTSAVTYKLREPRL